LDTDLSFQNPATMLLIIFAVSLLAMSMRVHTERLKARQRLQNLARKPTGPELRNARSPRGRSLKRPNTTLNAADQSDRKRRTTALSEFLAAAGFRRSLVFYMNSVLLIGGGIGAILWLAFSLGPSALLLGVLCATGGFYFLVKRSVRKRLQIIEQEFPAAIDIIVRGVRSGMPLNEGLRLVAAEAHPLIAKEFALVLDDLAVGIPLSQCIRRMAERMPIPDIQFFVVVLGLHSSAGGSVVNALASSAETIRSRRTLRQKVIVMSNEARVSALIIGALPILVMAAMAFTSPEYIGLLFSTTLGNVALAVTVFWMLLGVLVIRSMMNFEV